MRAIPSAVHGRPSSIAPFLGFCFDELNSFVYVPAVIEGRKLQAFN